jgi:hypothetical protein
MASTKGEDQEVKEEGVEVSVRRRTSDARRWEMDGNVQNLKRVALDWGSLMRLERRATEVAKV